MEEQNILLQSSLQLTVNINYMTNQKHVAGFIEKLYTIMEDWSISNIVTWADNDILIVNKQEFTNEVLPKYFRHQRLQSFIRQLNLYGFKKVQKADKEFICFRHQGFKKGERNNLHKVQLKSKTKQNDKRRGSFEIKESIRQTQQNLNSDKQKFQQHLALINQKLKSLVTQNPLLETELSSTFHLIDICTEKEDDLKILSESYQTNQNQDNDQCC